MELVESCFPSNLGCFHHCYFKASLGWISEGFWYGVPWKCYDLTPDCAGASGQGLAFSLGFILGSAVWYSPGTAHERSTNTENRTDLWPTMLEGAILSLLLSSDPSSQPLSVLASKCLLRYTGFTNQGLKNPAVSCTPANFRFFLFFFWKKNPSTPGLKLPLT